MTTDSGKNSRKFFVLGYLFIAAATVVCYFPSLYHLPRADQVAYFADTAGKNGFYSLAIQSFDLNRTRQFNAGDVLLFRPVVYFILGAEKYFFGYNFALWQLAGIVLHLLVTALLLKLLLTIRRSPWALIFTAFFALMLMGMEMVIWQHINSYMIFVAALLIALDQIYIYIERKDARFFRLLAVSLSMLIAGLTFDVANACTLLITAYFWARAPKDKKSLKDIAVLLLPIVLYAVFSAWDWFALGFDRQPHKLTAVNLDLAGSLNYFWQTMVYWLLLGLFPNAYHLQLGDRTVAHPGSGLSLLNLLSVTLIVLFCLIKIRTPAESRVLPGRAFCGLLLAIILAFTASIVFGRVVQRGTVYLIDNLYYCYIFWILFIPLVYAYADLNAPVGLLRAQLFKGAIVAVTAVFLCVNACRICNANLHEARGASKLRAVIAQIERQKKEDPGRLRVPVSVPGDYEVSWMVNKNDPQKKYRYLEALYLQ